MVVSFRKKKRKKLSTKNWIYDAICLSFSCDFQPYDFEIDHGNRFLLKFPRCNFFPIFNKNVGCRDIGHFVQNPDFFPVFNKKNRGVAQKLLEISVEVSKMFSKYFLFPLLWGSRAWPKFRLIRFLSKVIAKKPNWTNCSGRTICDGQSTAGED